MKTAAEIDTLSQKIVRDNLVLCQATQVVLEGLEPGAFQQGPGRSPAAERPFR